MKEVFLLLGTNLGDRVAQLNKARAAIDDQIGYITAYSSIYETAAWGNTEQPHFLNQVVRIGTELDDETVLEHILRIEKDLGRTRLQKWEARIIDIDILYYTDQIVDKPHLQIPHPLLSSRRFALMPLAEIAPDFIHPVLKKTNTELLHETSDSLQVNVFNAFSESPISDMKHLHDLANGDMNYVREIITLFLKQTPSDIERLLTHIADKQWDIVCQITHHIKPTMLYVGATKIHQEICELERLVKAHAQDIDIVLKAHAIQPDLAKVYNELNQHLNTLNTAS